MVGSDARFEKSKNGSYRIFSKNGSLLGLLNC